MIIVALILILSLCLLPSSNAQTKSLVAPGVLLEVGGAAPDYSLNYTQPLFTTDKVSAYWRIGTGLWKSRLAFPIGIGLLLGRQDHHPEFVFAITPYSQGLAFWKRDKSDLFLDLVIGLAYRYQPVDQSFFISGGVFPYLHLDPTTDMISEEQAQFRFRAGLSVGWFFN